MPDELTGLANLGEMHRVLESEFERRPQAPISLVLVDIDGTDMKVLNGTHDFQRGDEVLIAVAATIRDLTREADEVARWAGNKFAIVLPEADVEEAFLVAERVQAALERLRIPCPAPGDELQVTASFGVTSTPALVAGDKEGLFNAAKEALREAKEAGGTIHVRYEFTGLANLGEMHRVLESEFKRRPQAPISLVLVDIDGTDMTVLNGTHGWRQGDEVLLAVAATIRDLTREVDEVARWAGNKFAIVLPEADEKEAVLFAGRVRAALEQLRIPCPTPRDDLRVTACPAPDDEFQLTAWFGVASTPADAGDKDGLFSAAKEALRRAKEHGYLLRESTGRSFTSRYQQPQV